MEILRQITQLKLTSEMITCFVLNKNMFRMIKTHQNVAKE